MNTFTVNGNEYKAKAFDFNTVCDMEELGVSVDDMGRKPMSMVRAYLSVCSGKGPAWAGKELEQHMISGCDLEGIIKAMNAEMESSDFFRSIKEKEKKEAAADQSEADAKSE